MASAPLRKLIFSAAIAAALPLTAQAAPAQPNDFIDAFGKIFGEHKGIRKGHAKGVRAVGNFTASTEATARFDAALFSGATIPVSYRFSMAGGNPPPWSYATAEYFGIHTFYLANKSSKKR